VAGIYLHIPFCSKACSYCDFHFSTNLSKMDALAASIVTEIALQKGFFTTRPVIDTIYFGGGTPSLLPSKWLGKIIDSLRETHLVAGNAEVTLEANPDDLSAIKLRELREMGVNRLSIGIQSFSDADLLLLNRSHTSQQADRAVKAAQDLGIDNITVDLIYGIPGSGRQVWEENVRQAIALEVPHVSAYALTVEEKTLLHHQIARGLVSPEPDSAHESQYFHLIDRLGDAGILQYELSNFARDGYRSRHNSAYWKGVQYLGLGPSAHSYQDAKRSWNVSNNAAYTRALAQGKLPTASTETLTRRDQLNEYLMTQLRIVEGLDLAHVKATWGVDLQYQEEEAIDQWLRQGWLHITGDQMQLTRQGFMVSDAIIRELFQVEDDEEEEQ
jgi:oxygen-independent coproporphyrinogen III oxidase